MRFTIRFAFVFLLSLSAGFLTACEDEKSEVDNRTDLQKTHPIAGCSDQPQSPYFCGGKNPQNTPAQQKSK